MMEQSTNTEEAREAFMRHVFGDMMRLEEKLRETSQLIVASVDNMRLAKTALSRDTERLVLDALARIDRSAKSISGSEEKVASAAAEAARDILLNELGPVSKLNQIADRLFLREREATKWLTKAMDRATPPWLMVVVASIVGGLASGAIAKWL